MFKGIYNVYSVDLQLSAVKIIPGQRRNSVAELSKIDRQTVGFLIRIS